MSISFDRMRVPVKEADRRSGPYPYYGASGVVDYVDGYLFDGEYVLVAEDGENLRTRKTPIAWLARGKFWVNNHAHVLVANETSDTRYLGYALQGSSLVGHLSGSTIPKLTARNLMAIELAAPPLEDQRRIAHILGTLDDKIEVNRRMSETFEEMARALFKSWFVDFDPVRAKAEGRDTGLPPHIADLFPDRLVDSDLGAIPADWQIVPLEEICNVGIGKTPPRKEPEWFTYWGGEGVPWASVKDLASAAPFLDRTREQLTSAAIDRHRVRVAPAGSILLSFKLTIGRVAVTSVDMATNEAIAQIQLKEVAPGGGEYLRHYLSTFDYSSLGNTSSIATALNSRLIRGLQVVLPPDNVLRAFSAAVGVAQERQRVLLENARTLTEARDALLRNLIG